MAINFHYVHISHEGKEGSFQIKSPLRSPPSHDCFLPCCKEAIDSLLQEHLLKLLKQLVQNNHQEQERLQIALTAPTPLSVKILTLPTLQSSTKEASTKRVDPVSILSHPSKQAPKQHKTVHFKPEPELQILQAYIHQASSEQGDNPLFFLETSLTPEQQTSITHSIQQFSYLLEDLSHLPLPHHDWSCIPSNNTPLSLLAKQIQALACKCAAWHSLLRYRSYQLQMRLRNTSEMPSLATHVEELIHTAEKFQQSHEASIGTISPFFTYTINRLKETINEPLLKILPSSHKGSVHARRIYLYISALSHGLTFFTEEAQATYRMVCQKQVDALIEKKCRACKDLVGKIPHHLATIYDTDVHPYRESAEELFFNFTKLFLILHQINALLNTAEKENISSPTQWEAIRSSINSILPFEEIANLCHDFESLATRIRDGRGMEIEVAMLQKEYPILRMELQERLQRYKKSIVD